MADFLMRLWDRSRVTNSGCWEFEGGAQSNGYGMVGVCGGKELAHRLAFRLARGAIPAGLSVLHRCDNRRCINPDHLFLGTQADNMADMAAKGRGRCGAPMPKTRGQRHWNCQLRPQDVIEIRARFGGESQRSLARRFGVSRRTIEDIGHGRSWGWLSSQTS